MGAVANALYGALATTDVPLLHAGVQQRSSDSLVQVQESLANLRSRLVADGADDLRPLARWLQDLHDHARTAVDDLPTANAPARVVLMGRTQAGKSTLFNYLTGTADSAVGLGGQRTTLKVFRAPYRHDDRILIADAPGVGARDGSEDQRVALNEARRADLVVWVFTTDSLPEDTRANLALVASWGVPMIPVLQCLYGLIAVPPDKELDELQERVFLKTPTMHPVAVMAEYEGHRKRADRTFADARQDPGPWIPVHAQAALLSAGRTAECAGELLEASNVRELERAIEVTVGANLDARRMVATADIGRRALEEIRVHLQSQAVAVREQVVNETKEFEDLREKIDGELQRFRTRHSRALRSRLQRLDTWADGHYRDDDKTLAEEWSRTENDVDAAIKEIERRHWKSLEHRLGEIHEDVSASWRKVAKQQAARQGPRSKVAVNPVWLDPAVKAGVGVAGGIVGGLLSGGNPLGAIAGAAVAEILGSFISSWFGNRRSQLNKRRGDLHHKVLEAKDEILAAALAHWDRQVAEILTQLEEFGSRTTARIGRLGQYADHMEGLSVSAGASVTNVDELLVRDLLALRGYQRVADEVREARRTPGGTTLVGLGSERALEEVVLRPPVGLGDVRYYPAHASAVRRVAHAVRLGRIDTQRSGLSFIDSSGPSLRIVMDVPTAAVLNEQWVATTVSGEECEVAPVTQGKATP